MAKRIVVADNDPEWLALIVLDLGLEGHEIVAEAASGQEAIDRCATLAPDLLVVDHRMPPGISGLDVARHLAATSPDLPVIVFSNYEDREVIRGVRDTGAQFVLKTNLRALRRAIDEI